MTTRKAQVSRLESYRLQQSKQTCGNTLINISPVQVVQYVGFVDCVDTEGGHGTHVAGSAAGALSETSPGGHFGDGVSFSTGLCLLREKNVPVGLVNGWIYPARSTWEICSVAVRRWCGRIARVGQCWHSSVAKFSTVAQLLLFELGSDPYRDICLMISSHPRW